MLEFILYYVNVVQKNVSNEPIVTYPNPTHPNIT